MSDVINFNNQPQAIDFNKIEVAPKNFNEDYELEMQTLAGIEPNLNFQAVRDSLAQERVDEEKDYNAQMAEYGLMTGNLSVGEASFLVNSQPAFRPDNSLENAVARVQVEEGLTANEDQAAIEYTNRDGATEEYARKAAAQAKFIKDLHDYSDNSQGFIGDTLDFAKSAFVPGNVQFRHMANYSKTLTGDETSWTHHGLAENIRNNMMNNYVNMSADEYEAYLGQAYKEIVAGNRNRIMLDDYIEAIEFGGNNLLEGAAALDAAQWVAGPVKAIGKYATKAFAKGFNKLVGRNLSKTIIKEGNNMSKVDTVLETAAKPVSQTTPGTTFNGIASNDISEAVYETVKNDVLIEGLEESEEKALLEVMKGEAYKKFKLTKNEPLDAVLNYAEDGNINITYTLGGSGGQGLTKEQAEKLSKRFEKAGVDAQVFQMDGTGCYMKFTQEVAPDDANQFIHLVSDPIDWLPLDTSKGLAKVFQAPLAFIGKYFLSNANTPDVAHAKDVASARIHGKLLAKYAKLKEPLNALDSEEMGLLTDVVKKGNVESVWFTEDKLRSFGLSDKGVEAYNNYRTAEDLSYVYKNYVARRDLAQRGNKLYASKWIGKETPMRDDILARASIIDENGNAISRKVLDAAPDDYVLVKLDTINNTDATHLAIKKVGGVTEGELPPTILPYRAGGRREYMEGTQFIRVLGDVKDAEGHVVDHRIRTIATADNAVEAKEMTREINEVIKIVKEVGKGKNAALEGTRRLSQLDLKYFRVSSWDQVKELVEKGIISENGLAKYMLDGKKFLLNTGENAIESDDWSSEMAMLNGRFVTHRGNILEDVLGHQAAIYSVDEMFTKAVRKSAALGARGDLMLWYKKALAQYASVLENPSETLNLNAIAAIRNATLIPRNKVAQGADASLYRSAENFLKHARAMSNAKTAGEEWVQRGLDNIAYNFIKSDKEMSKSIGHNIIHWNPTMAVQHIVFNKNMGWFAPSQLMKQAQGVSGVLAKEPLLGAKAIAALPLVMTAALTPDAKHIGRLGKALGMSADDAKGLLKYMKKYGTKESAGLLTGAEVLQQKVLSKGKTTASLYRWLADHQYDFMRWGNAFNYYVADITAYMAKKNKSYRDIAAYSDDLFMNMTRTSTADIQRGLTAPLTQWLSYPMRFAETMLNRRMTKAEKLKFLSIQTALYGTEGVLGGNIGQYIYAWDGMDKDTKALVANGLAGLVSETTGVDFRDGPKIIDVPLKFMKLIGMSDGRTNIKQIAAAAGGDYVRDLSSTIYDFVIRVPFTDMELSDWAFRTAKRKDTATSFKSAAKVGLALKYNKIMNHNGIIREDPTKAQIIWQALGYQPNEAFHQRMVDVLAADQQENVKELIDDFGDLLTDLEKYNLEELSKYREDESFMRKIREFDEKVRLSETAIEGIYGEGSSAAVDFRKGLMQKVTKGIPYLSEEAMEKATKKLNYSQQALLIEVMRRDK